MKTVKMPPETAGDHNPMQLSNENFKYHAVDFCALPNLGRVQAYRDDDP